MAPASLAKCLGRPASKTFDINNRWNCTYCVYVYYRIQEL